MSFGTTCGALVIIRILCPTETNDIYKRIVRLRTYVNSVFILGYWVLLRKMFHILQTSYLYTLTFVDIQSGQLPGRSGQIQAAINLEIPDANIKYFNVKIEGLNGQLPNLDLVNLVVRLCHKNNVDIMLHNSVSCFSLNLFIFPQL